MHLVLFEGSDFATLAPFTFVRPAFLLRCGVTTLLEKQIRHLSPTRISLWVRPALAPLCRSQAIPTIREINDVPIEVNQPLDDQPAVLCDGRSFIFSKPETMPRGVVACGLSPTDALSNSDRFQSVRGACAECKFPLAQRPWDLLTNNSDALLSDIADHRSRWRSLSGVDGPFHVVHPDDVLLAGDVTLKPGCVLDASGGPIALGANVVIGHNAVVQGPCYIGEHSEIAPLALIRSRTSIGPRCKFGGEVSAVIAQRYSNKAHDGFLGDSYLGAWVNLGAGTTTSNLKNTYGPVSIHADRGDMETGRQFLGSLIGDHSKTAIGTRLMTGSYVGVSSMIATSNHPPRFVPSFRFLTDDRDEPYRLDKALEVATTAYARRQTRFTPEDADLLAAASRWSADYE